MKTEPSITNLGCKIILQAYKDCFLPTRILSKKNPIDLNKKIREEAREFIMSDALVWTINIYGVRINHKLIRRSLIMGKIINSRMLVWITKRGEHEQADL